ncbi:MAG: RagB/SusD family nutrient uptake outer membrane protein, partial [Bacteroidales bacterium]|nr:RagB/SusD family nutrient uptake outer membrane protein [Bacteroidales bacterium]
MAVQVINDPAYAFAPLEDIFSITNQENSEIIFSWQFSNDEFQNLNGAKQRTSMQLTPLYDRVNGVARTHEQGGRPWSRMSPTEYYWTLFEEDDLRLEAWHKRYWIYDIDSAGVDELPPGVSIGDTATPENIVETSGYGARVIEPTTTKYWEGGELGRTTEEAEGYRNIIQYRLSQAYLIAAEAYLRAGNAPAGQPYLDAVRTRAGVGTIELNEQNILDEQARELGHEGHRYPMLKRLNLVIDRVRLYSPEIGANMLPHHVRLPIPQQFVDLTKVPQNEGY